MRHQVCFPGQDEKSLRTETYHSVAEGPSIYFAAYPYGAALNAQSVEYLRDYLTTWLENDDKESLAAFDNTNTPSISIRVPSKGDPMNMRAHWFLLKPELENRVFQAVVTVAGKPDIRRPW